MTNPYAGMLFFDCETFCDTPLKEAGGYRYSERVEIMVISYAIEGGAVGVVDLTAGEQLPPEFMAAWNNPAFRIVIQNSMFDRVMLNATGLLPLTPERIIDTMVWALSHGLPGALGSLCEIMGVEESLKKLTSGKNHIQLFCKPRPKNSKLRRATRETHPNEWQDFLLYAGSDIHAMRALVTRLPRVNYPAHEGERALWVYDQRMNDRGIPVDRQLAYMAIRASDIAQAGMSTDVYMQTGGEVQAATQRDAMLKFILETHGVELPNMQAATLERRLDDPDLPQPVKDLIALRLEASTTSVSKYKRLLVATNSDGRLRGCIQFSGAARTQRDAGRIFQPQNLPRPSLKWPELEVAIDDTLAGILCETHDKPLTALSSMIRSAIVAPPGRKLVVSDLSNIEGRAQAWLAGEQWKLKAFSEFDAGIGFDLYVLAYAKTFGVAPNSVDKAQRFIGKVLELSLGYQGGVKAVLSMALAYGVDIQDMAEKIAASMDSETLARARSNWGFFKSKNLPTHGLSEFVWCALEAVKISWRDAHENINRFWFELEDVARKAIENPGEKFRAGKHLTFVRRGAWLYMYMPSGTACCYPGVQLDDEGKISYMGINQYSRKWQRLKTYGGKLLENACQKLARDRMFYNIPAIESAGYDIVLRVHDEVICEVPDSPEYSAEKLSELLATVQPWAKGFPTAAAGFETYRYRKQD